MTFQGKPTKQIVLFLATLAVAATRDLASIPTVYLEDGLYEQSSASEEDARKALAEKSDSEDEQIHQAAPEGGSFNEVILLEKEIAEGIVDVYARYGEEKDTLLHRAAAMGNIRTAEAFLIAGKKQQGKNEPLLLVKNRYGRIPLHEALEKGLDPKTANKRVADMVELLLSAGEEQGILKEMLQRGGPP